MIATTETLTYSDLKKVKLVRPDAAGEFWQGIKHTDLIDAVSDQLQTMNYGVLGTTFALSPDDADMAAVVSVDNGDAGAPKGWNLCVGIQTSNARRRGLSFVVGIEHLDGYAICFAGNTCAKHSSGFDLNDEVRTALKVWQVNAVDVVDNYDMLKTVKFTKIAETDHILMEAGRFNPRQGRMPWVRIGRVEKLVREKRLAAGGTITAVQLLTAFGAIVKQDPPLRQMDEMLAFHKIVTHNFPTAEREKKKGA